MRKFQFHDIALKMVAMALMVTILLLFASCGESTGKQSGKSTKEQLVGSWYKNGKTSITRDGSRGPIFILYDDGTCELASEYGTGRWSVVNEDQLKLTNFYGESSTATIVSVENGELTLDADGTQTTYFNELRNDLDT